MGLNVQCNTTVTLLQERYELRITQKACERHAQSIVADRLLYTPETTGWIESQWNV